MRVCFYLCECLSLDNVVVILCRVTRFSRIQKSLYSNTHWILVPFVVGLGSVIGHYPQDLLYKLCVLY